MTDPYATLGLSRTSTDAEIRKAFRSLSRKHHPDLKPGDAAAEERFKEISAAYDLLRDPERRRRFDAGEVDATGAERPQQRYYRDFTAGAGAGAGGQGPWGGAGQGEQGGFAGEEDLEDFLSRAFGAGRAGGGFGGFGRGAARGPARGADVSYTLPVAFLDAATGATHTVTLPDGTSLRVTIPEGAEEGQVLRLRGQGAPGAGGGQPGDAYVELRVDPHPFFTRTGDDIHVEVPVTLKEAVLGARIEVPTVTGPVTLTVPKRSNTGRTLRLRARGLRNRRTGERGNQLVTLRVVLPRGEEPELAAFLEQWTPVHAENPRREML